MHPKASTQSLPHLPYIERRIARCDAFSRRFVWVRLTVFLVGGASTWGSAALFGPGGGWCAFAAATLLFIGVVILHRRLDRWNEKFHIWHDLHAEQLARLTLDWAHIPDPIASAAPSPLSLDLDLTGQLSLHHLLDRAISRQGSLRLAEWLTAGVPDEAKIAARQGVVSDLKGLPRFCNRLLLTYRQLARQPLDDDKLLDWLSTPVPEAALRRVLPWATLLSAANVTLFVLNAAGRLPPYWLLSLLAYAGLYIASQGAISKFLAAVIRLDSELNKFRPLLHFIENYPYGNARELATVCAPFTREAARPTRLLRQVKWSTASAGLRMNPALGLLLNLLTPWDFWAAWLAARQKERMARLLPAWLDTFHELEALISLGMFATQNPNYTFPQIAPVGTQPNDGESLLKSLKPSAASAPKMDSPTAVFAARQLGHPLLPPTRRVCNDFVGRSLGELNLITGSNMAGKSTFLRTLGVNLCLAYAGGPVCATRFHTAPFRLYTCIRVSDSLGDGFSYFYAEVKRLKGLLDAINEPSPQAQKSEPAQPGSTKLPLLYLIDELFRGTNNRERLIGSRAYIKALLDAPALGFIATHDLELATLADAHPQLHNYHFRDDVSGGILTFDYQIRPGASPTTNALKIMALEGLPVDGQ